MGASVEIAALPVFHLKTRILLALMVLLQMFAAVPVWGQTAQITGKILDKDGKPLAEAQIVYTSLTTNKSFKVKTDKNGEFVELSVPYGNYQVEVLGSDGQSLFKQKAIVNLSPESRHLVIDLSTQASSGKPAISKEQAEAIKEKNKQLLAENALITKYETARQDKNWQEAENILGQLIALNPDRWEYQKSLGDVQFNQVKYDEALASYEKSIPPAQGEDASKGNPAATKIALAQML